MRLSKKDKCGFTILEVLVGMIVLGISLMGILMLFSKGAMFIAEVQANDLVVDMLEQEMEVIRQETFANIVASPPGAFMPAGFNQLINPIGTVNVDYPYGMAFPFNRIIRVTVTISWDSPSGQFLNRSLVTYISDLGISS